MNWFNRQIQRWNFKSIETITVVFFLLRLISITNPPLETGHSWRQTMTSMMARNMSENYFSLIYPRVDHSGTAYGIIASEFPFFQSLIASANLILDYDHWYGRLINLIVCSIAVYCFYKIILKCFNERTAWFSSVVFLTSLWFSFSRKIMPDTFAVALVIIGIYFVIAFIENAKMRNLLFAFVFLTLGGLCKIPAVFLFSLVVPLFFIREISRKIKIQITLAVAISSCIILGWYFVWVPYLLETYRVQLYFPKGIAEGIKEIQPLLPDFFKQFYFGALRSYAVLLPVCIGIYLLFKKHKFAGLSLILPTLVFLLFSVKTGAVFPTHNYYVLPFVPILALVAGLGFDAIPGKWSLALVAFVAVEAIANQWTDFRIKDEVKYRLTLEDQIDKILPRKEKIIIHFGVNPEWMYYYHRKGWSLTEEEMSDTALFRKIRSQGGKYIVIDKRVWTTPLDYPVYGESEDCIVYSNVQQ